MTDRPSGATRTRAATIAGSLGAALAARLELPARGAPRAAALFAHCFTCSKDLGVSVRVSRALAARGIATLRLDFTGHGESEGEFADTTFSSNVDDLVAAAGWLEAEVAAPRLLVGHSLGGAACLVAASRLPSVRAVATIAAPSELAHVREQMRDELAEIERSGEAEVVLAGRRFVVRDELLRDLDAVDLRAAVGSLGAALLLLHAPEDRTVAVEHAAQLYTAAPHPKSFVALPGSGHLLREAADAEYAASVIAAWAERYLGD